MPPVTINRDVVGGGGSATQSGTTDEMLAATGAAGDLYFNTSYNALFQWVDDRWWPINPDPRYGSMYYDDFMSANQIGWTYTNTGSNLFANTSAIGFIQQGASAASSFCRAQMSTAGILLSGQIDSYMELLVRIPTLATAPEDYSTAFGFNDMTSFNGSSLATDGVYFNYSRGLNGANWNLIASTNDTHTIVTTTSVIAAATPYRLGLMMKGATTADFYVNRVQIGTITTGFPTGNARNSGIGIYLNKAFGSALSSWQLDYFAAWAFFNGGRSV